MFYREKAEIENLTRTGVLFPYTRTISGEQYRGMGISAYAAAAYTRGDVVMISFSASATAGQEYAVVAVATKTVAAHMTVVALDDVAAGKIGAFAMAGDCIALVDGDSTDVTANDYLKAVNAAENFVIDHATVPTAKACAIAIEANAATSALKKVMLIPREHTI